MVLERRDALACRLTAPIAPRAFRTTAHEDQSVLMVVSTPETRASLTEGTPRITVLMDTLCCPSLMVWTVLMQLP